MVLRAYLGDTQHLQRHMVWRGDKGHLVRRGQVQGARQPQDKTQGTEGGTQTQRHRHGAQYGRNQWAGTASNPSDGRPLEACLQCLRGGPTATSVLRAGCNSPPAVMAALAAQARERPSAATVDGVSRPGVIPGPTVTVRMKESANPLPGGGVSVRPARPWARAP